MNERIAAAFVDITVEMCQDMLLEYRQRLKKVSHEVDESHVEVHSS